MAGVLCPTIGLFSSIAGGENWGTQPLSQYSWSQADWQVESIWCPTTSNHSGKPFYHLSHHNLTIQDNHLTRWVELSSDGF